MIGQGSFVAPGTEANIVRVCIGGMPTEKAAFRSRSDAR